MFERKPKLRVLRIDEIEQDPNFYPRERTSWIVSYKYSEALKTGAKFPPITVAEFDGRFVLVDGWHRIEAHKLNKETHIQAEILTGLTPDQIYIEALVRNTKHGQPLTTTEVTKAILKLTELKLPMEEISKIINIPVEKIKPFIVKRVVSVATGKEVLKKSTYHLTGKPNLLTNPYALDRIGGTSQEKLIEDIILLIRNKWIDLKNTKVKLKLKELKRLLRGLKL